MTSSSVDHVPPLALEMRLQRVQSKYAFLLDEKGKIKPKVLLHEILKNNTSDNSFEHEDMELFLKTMGFGKDSDAENKKKYASKENEPRKHADEYTPLRKGESDVESYPNAKDCIFSNSSSRSLPINSANVPHRNECPSLHSPETVHFEPKCKYYDLAEDDQENPAQPVVAEPS